VELGLVSTEKTSPNEMNLALVNKDAVSVLDAYDISFNKHTKTEHY